MRRTAAPSFRQGQSVPGCSPLEAISSHSDNTNLINATSVHNAARNTSSILNLLSSDNKPETVITVSPTAKDATPRHTKIVFNVVWGKKSTKKHKTWVGDGTLEVWEKSAILKDEDGTIIGRTSGINTAVLAEGNQLFVGSKEVEIIDIASSATTENVMQPACKQRKMSQVES